jgi:hypothetical protein
MFSEEKNNCGSLKVKNLSLPWDWITSQSLIQTNGLAFSKSG